MRKEFYEQIMETLAENGDVKGAIYQIRKENERGYQVADQDNTGCTILKMIHPNTFTDIHRDPQNAQFAAEVAELWADNDGINMMTDEILRDLYDMLEAENE